MISKAKEKLIILVAPTGETPSREGGPNVPCTPEEIAEETYKCYQAGASIVHVHARDKKTKLHTSDLSVFKEIVTRIKEKCEILIQLTGAMGALQDPVTKEWIPPTVEKRLALLSLDPKPNMTCAPAGSSNYYGPSGKFATLVNTPEFLKTFIATSNSKNLKWEMEIWDASYLNNAIRLSEEGAFNKDMRVWLNYCFGEGDGYQPATSRQLLYMAEEGKRIFQNAIWEVTIRGKYIFPLHAIAMSLGCNISRVGLEDHVCLPNGDIAINNVQIVESAVKLAKAIGREIATVADAKEIMGLPE